VWFWREGRLSRPKTHERAADSYPNVLSGRIGLSGSVDLDRVPRDSRYACCACSPSRKSDGWMRGSTCLALSWRNLARSALAGLRNYRSGHTVRRSTNLGSRSTTYLIGFLRLKTSGQRMVNTGEMCRRTNGRLIRSSSSLAQRVRADTHLGTGRRTSTTARITSSKSLTITQGRS